MQSFLIVRSIFEALKLQVFQIKALMVYLYERFFLFEKRYMEDIFITKVKIKSIRHLKDFEIPLSIEQRKHLILTGKNGSGKTSVLDELGEVIDYDPRKYGLQETFSIHNEGISLSISDGCQNGKKPIIACFQARRKPEFERPKSIEKFSDFNGKKLLQHLLNQTAERAFALEQKEDAAVKQIEDWLENFKQQLREIFEDPKLEFVFDRQNFNYFIHQEGRSPVTLSELSDGFSSIVEIIAELIMQIEAKGESAQTAQGIVLIDEVETHLHISLQKRILPMLTSFFPKMQFIVSTHSPFVLSSVKNAVICDLERRIVTEDLSGYSSELLVESYFESDKFSGLLKNDLARFEALVDQENLSEEEEEELELLQRNLNAIPKYLSEELIVKLQQIKRKQLKPAR